jgi:hypothetical protein
MPHRHNHILTSQNHNSNLTAATPINSLSREVVGALTPHLTPPTPSPTSATTSLRSATSRYIYLNAKPSRSPLQGR